MGVWFLGDPGIKSGNEHGVYRKVGDAGRQFLFPILSDYDGPELAIFGIGVENTNATALNGKIELFQFFEKDLGAHYQIVTMPHGHGLGANALQGGLDLCFPGLGFCFLEVEEAGVGLFEDFGNLFENIYLIFCKWFSSNNFYHAIFIKCIRKMQGSGCEHTALFNKLLWQIFKIRFGQKPFGIIHFGLSLHNEFSEFDSFFPCFKHFRVIRGIDERYGVAFGIGIVRKACKPMFSRQIFQVKDDTTSGYHKI